jgi:TAT (twin-arginine translocation) pathway signal sequence.
MAESHPFDFDHLAKSFAKGMSRRELLRGLVGAAGAALLAPFLGG